VNGVETFATRVPRTIDSEKQNRERGQGIVQTSENARGNVD